MIREEIIERITHEWANLQAVIARVPPDRMVDLPVVGTWTVKDLMGHVTTWEADAMDNIAQFLASPNGQMRSYPDPDEFNARTSEAKQAVPLRDISRGFEETHAKLIEFLKGLPNESLLQEPVAGRIRLDTYAHYPEHASAIQDWLG
jgi:hypothetical protein